MATTPAPDPLPLRGRRALVTGASRGLGAATARGLAAAGADVALLCRRRAEEAAGTARAIRELGRDCEVLLADVADWEACRAAVESAASRLGGLDIVVANAGVANPHVSLADTPVDRWRKIMGVNLDGPFHTVKAAAPWLTGSPHGSVVFVSSVGGLRAAPMQAAYGAAKAALGHLARSWAAELAPLGVRVNTVVPGLFRTDMTQLLRQARPDGGDGLVPLGRVGAPAELADAVVYLCSDAASYITGAELPVDGGMSA
ncbi:NAD(P)-dependent dehydrogenase, short-chain alcohol dehydrogenase family [Thermomonospora echinospora]|uniref:NAD(P)-dependent dehydrogenase, short-chain alcohol dehydrogenase family n=1 Tax=Thermomonospora echinospora TaxID=1992 RepID=A0A1H6E8S5_9ACTN|nr:SDR family NAD(P)-dependent oxidoreductase [Thermomonospora echinospora]SEG93529.1 NAD(P)-dependent dehydrogenase, short-chain alcohol dehydrogenase family [Thermomonospora echinospora]